MSRRPTAPSRPVLAVVSATLALKLIFLAVVVTARPQALIYIDTGTYVRPALALLRSGTFSPSPEVAPEPEINRTPGYPLLIAATWGVFGARPWALPVLGALLSAGTALVAAGLAARLFGARAAVLAAIFVSCEPGTFFRSLDALSDTPFTFFLTLFVDALARYASGDATSPARAGLWLAFATLVRPLSYYLIPLAAILVFVVARRAARSPLAASGMAAAFLAPAVLFVGGWEVRNLVRAQAFTFSPIAGSQLLFYHAAPVLARAEHVPIPEMQERLGNRERWYRSGGGTERDIFGGARYTDLFPETSRLSLVELNVRWRRQAFTIFGLHPSLSIAMALKGVGILLLTPPSLILSAYYGLFSPDPTVIALYEDQRVVEFAARLAGVAPLLFGVSAGLLLLLAALWAAAVRGFRAARAEIPAVVHVALVGTFLYVVAVSAGFESADDRFRLPLVPIACVYASRSFSGSRAGVVIRS